MHLSRSVLADLVLWVVMLALNQTVALPLVVRPKGRVAKPANDPGMTFGALTLDDTIAHYQVLRRNGVINPIAAIVLLPTNQGVRFVRRIDVSLSSQPVGG